MRWTDGWGGDGAEPARNTAVAGLREGPTTAEPFCRRCQPFRPKMGPRSQATWQPYNMHRVFQPFAASLLNPTNRVRMQCLVLLAMQVVALLYLEAHPQSVLHAGIPWNTTAGPYEYGLLAALSWVVVGGRSPGAAVALAGSIILLNEGMRQYTPGGTTGIEAVGIDLIGAASVVLLLSALRAWHVKRASQARPVSDAGSGDPYQPS